MKNQPSPANLLKWFDPRKKSMGSWAFILNRITAIGLTVYLYLHLIMLSKLVQGPESYNSFIATAKTPLILFGELLVVSAVLIHGLNGIRIALNSFGIGVRKQTAMFLISMGIAILFIFYFIYKMFFAG
ncbi:MAG: succinate dehydrogenase, cytochrome b556 subunit [Anaerolineaceae bacterium]|jgi:succinate dehydrogenase / fumarate reductase cytochrome b subunit